MIRQNEGKGGRHLFTERKSVKVYQGISENDTTGNRSFWRNSKSSIYIMNSEIDKHSLNLTRNVLIIAQDSTKMK